MKTRKILRSGKANLYRREGANFSSFFLLLLIAVLIVTFFYPANARADDPVLLKDIYVGATGSQGANFVDVDGTLFFAADDGTHGMELWRSDGTDGSTQMIKDINASGNSSPSGFVNIDGIVYFAADDGVHGVELWKTDGTGSGTVMVKDINPGQYNSSPASLVNVNRTLFFAADDYTNGIELWKSDGTEAGTVMVKDINPGSYNSSPTELINVNGMLFFSAYLYGSGVELWKSDGTEAGTVMIKDIRPGSEGSSPAHLISMDNTLFFTADDGEKGVELWKTDGTGSSTKIVKDIYSGRSSSSPSYLTVLNGHLYFAASSAYEGTELWMSDGTASGTELLKDIYVGSHSSSPACLVAVGDTLFFLANDGTNGNELWKSDGSPAGTVMVKDILNGSGSSVPENLVNHHGLLFFTADDGTNGRELWTSDGTDAGTSMVMDIHPSGSSAPELLTPVGSRLYFVADDGSHGIEPWVMLTNTPPAISSISKQSTFHDDPVGPISFTVSDLETDAGSLTVTATSSNQTLLPDANITLAGSGSNRTILLTPATGQLGSATVTITVTDGGSASSQVTFDVEWYAALVVAPSAGPGVDYTTIAAAATAASDGDTIILKDGVYTGSGNKNIDLDGTKTLTIKSAKGRENTIIDLQNDGRAFYIHGGDQSTIDGLTIKNGNATGNANYPNQGGSIYVSSSEDNSPTITNCTFENNYAPEDGGAIHLGIALGSAHPVIRSCSFLRNTADYEGGAIFAFLYGSGTGNGYFEISDSEFTRNSSTFGGAIRAEKSEFATPSNHSTIEKSTFYDNTASHGGAVHAETFAANGFTTIFACTFSGNRANIEGGAIIGMEMTIESSIFLKNKANAYGGAISLTNTVSVARTDITNCSFFDNSTLGDGGAIHSTGNLNLNNSILWANSASGKGKQMFFYASTDVTLNIDHCDIQDGLSDTYDESDSDHVNDLGGNIAIDPLFALNEDLHLMPGSPCIDAGNNVPIGGLPQADRDGKPRYLNGDGDSSSVVDIGAYEFEPTYFPAAGVSPKRLIFTATLGRQLPNGQNISICSRGLGKLQWKIVEDIPWLRIENEEGSSTGETNTARVFVDYTVDGTLLSHGIYQGTIEVRNSLSDALYQTIEVFFFVAKEMHVPGEYGTIQAAIDAAIDGDEIILASQEYKGEGNKNLDFLGKAIILRSENGPDYAVINCEGSGRGARFHRGEGPNSVLQGLTIKNGNVGSEKGGGILIDENASPTIVGCILGSNSSEDKGGGMAILGSHVYVAQCSFTNNTATTTYGDGGGIYVGPNASYITIQDSTFSTNSATHNGGGIYSYSSSHFTVRKSRFESNYSQTGGAIYSLTADVCSISECYFSYNSANSGGALNLYGLSDGTHNVSNSVFLTNAANYNGGGIYGYDGYLNVTNCTFYYNRAHNYGSAIYASSLTASITNSIIWHNRYWGGSSYLFGRDISDSSSVITISYCDTSYSNACTNYNCTGVIYNDPLFLDTSNNDFRLDPASPCIDAGTTIPWLFSDIRGSVRPVDGNADGTAAFDIGAYEYSEYYGGLPGDQTAKGFQDLGIGGSLAVTNYDYTIKWKDRDPFPDDPRISQADEYDVRLALVNEYGYRIELGTYTMQGSQVGYSIPVVFGPEHIGTWRIRLEMVSDPNQFLLSDEITIKHMDVTRYALSQWIHAPEGADPTVKPDLEDENACYWSPETNRLYAIKPATMVITWYEDENREKPVPMVVYMDYPDKDTYPTDPDVYIHIADSMAVDLLPEGTRFDTAKIMYTESDANTARNQFVASIEGWTVLMYTDQQENDPDKKEIFDVVRTYVWNHNQSDLLPPHPILNPNFPYESTWDIGKEVIDPEHCPDCKSGWIFFEHALYDGYGTNKAYDRSVREGPIFLVNEDDPTTEKDDLIVVWYKKSAASGVCWPSKPVRYDPQWPANPKIAVIASGLGSGPLPPEKYGLLDNMIVYNQPDRNKPGYNPNEEHASFFTAQGSADPGVFPLRTDLNKPTNRPDDESRTYLPGDRSRPYVLLKYQDPQSARWNFEVYKVVAQSKSYSFDGGSVRSVEDYPPGSNRYYIASNASLTSTTGVFPQDSYYLDAQGLLKKHGETQQKWYNKNGSSIVETTFTEVHVYYIEQNGDLTDLGLLSGSPSLPDNRYLLDIHGVIVEANVYYRFQYTGIAGQEINPPYPVNQLTFGPCTESYVDPATEEAVLTDKDHKFFAKNGGYGTMPVQDVVLHYFYRMQNGFWYDMDENGVPDKTIGTPVAWLEGLDGNFNSDPVPITYSIVWPDPVPTLHVGETLLDAKMQEGETVGLPNVMDQCIVQVLFDQADKEGYGPSAKLIDPLKEYEVDFDWDSSPNKNTLNSKLKTEPGDNDRIVFKALPQYIQSRLTYDPLAGDHGRLKLKGIYEATTGEPTLLLNTLTDRDMMEIARVFLPDPNSLDPADSSLLNNIPADFKAALDTLRGLGDAGLNGTSLLKLAEIKALTAGDTKHVPSYVTLAFNNDPDDCPGPVTLSVIKVNCDLYRGEIKVFEPDDVFGEKVTLRHNGDFGGHPGDRWFQWKYLAADFSGIPVGPGTSGENWQDYFAVLHNPGSDTANQDDKDQGNGDDNDIFYKGAADVTVQGTGQQLLPDKWFSIRYYYYEPSLNCNVLSDWTEPQLYEGWVKRVMKKINLFDQKVKDFHDSEVNTLASMISLAGPRYEGDVALNSDPENLQNLGIIETYHTLLNRAEDLSINQGNPVDLQDINKAILFAANRLAGLYIMLGNEAYADAMDPTIGFSTEDGQFGNEAPSVFCFENQVDSLIEEELALLRGRADEGVRPFYNHLIWNFTLGDGEVAYKENYNITDQNQDGEVDQEDAMIQYPQGHGDAWGHYLTALTYYYDLLRNPYFTWEPQTEAILVGQVPVEVDYRDERQFAVAAAAKAKAGAEIVNLTYRDYYVEDPEEQWQGYRDLNVDRSWGVDGWSRRAGQGAFFDWVVGNAILPPESIQEAIPEDQNASEGQTAFVLQFIHYNPDNDPRVLQVYVNNVLQPPDVYEVTCDTNPDPVVTTVTFDEGLHLGDAVHFEFIKLKEGMQRIDRTTVVELRDITSQYLAVQSQVDQADAGLNPLGLAKDVVPFDIDPEAIDNGQTHFEQVYAKAVQAMNNAIVVFNHANQSTLLLRHQQDTLADFQRNIEDREADFNNRLIEVFGYPYPDDCGPGKTYPTGYDSTGPDIYHYMYVDPSELMGEDYSVEFEFPVTYKELDVDADGALSEHEKTVTYHVSTDSRFGMVKPQSWTSRRKAPGEIQMAYSELLLARGRFEKALDQYDALISRIERQADLIEAQYGLNRDQIQVLNEAKAKQVSLNESIRAAKNEEVNSRTAAKIATLIGNAAMEVIPKVIGLATDTMSALRGIALTVASTITQSYNLSADNKVVATLENQQDKEITSLETNIKLTSLRGDFAIQQQLLQLENLVRTEATLHYEIENLVEAMQQAARNYLRALTKGQRLLEERLRFRKQTAGQIVNYRYKDMTFRIFRNDALQKYKAQLDMAARYVYLAAKAYDYETSLLNEDTRAGEAFLTDIVRRRTIGTIQNGQPLTGTGLADPMKRMWQNFQVLKGQMGFNNPQIETNRFSLRQELFRIRMDEGSNETWQKVLEDHRVDNLWDIPEFRRYCRPFAPEGIAQPGIVIPFSTTVTSGLNLFRWPLGGGDSYYSATNFATKVRAVGVWFSNYNSVGLAQTPRVYLIPAGQDVLRSPDYYNYEVRTWHVVDQKMPLPFPIVETELQNNPGWIPEVDTIFDEMFQIRRHSDFRAYHDSGYLNESEMKFDSRLVGRSVWNTRWLLIIPGSNLLYDPDEGLDTFIYGPVAPGGQGERSGNGVSDIKLFFETYAYSGN